MSFVTKENCAFSKQGMKSTFSLPIMVVHVFFWGRSTYSILRKGEIAVGRRKDDGGGDDDEARFLSGRKKELAFWWHFSQDLFHFEYVSQSWRKFTSCVYVFIEFDSILRFSARVTFAVKTRETSFKFVMARKRFPISKVFSCTALLSIKLAQHCSFLPRLAA